MVLCVPLTNPPLTYFVVPLLVATFMTALPLLLEWSPYVLILELYVVIFIPNILP